MFKAMCWAKLQLAIQQTSKATRDSSRIEVRRTRVAGLDRPVTPAHAPMRLRVIRRAVVQRHSNRGKATVSAEAIDLRNPAAVADPQGPAVGPASPGAGSAMSRNANITVANVARRRNQMLQLSRIAKLRRISCADFCFVS